MTAIVAGVLAFLVIAFLERFPTPALPIPSPERGACRDLLRVDRQARALLRRGRANAAAQLLERYTGPEHAVQVALRGWALLQTGHPGEAKAIAAGLPDQAPSRLLVTGLAELELSNPTRARSVLRAAPNPPRGAKWARTFDDHARISVPQMSYSQELLRIRVGGEPRKPPGWPRRRRRRTHAP